MGGSLIYRETNLTNLLETMGPYLQDVSFDPEEWFSNDRNLALTDGGGNYGLFTYEKSQLVSGHYFMKDRGKKAYEVSKEIISEVFSKYEVETIMGLTPIRHKGALLMNRKLGFKSYGEVETMRGPAELVILTKKEYKWDL